MLAALLQIDPGLAEACGSEPGVVCKAVYDITGNGTAAEIAQIAAKPITALMILVFAWILNRIVRRTIDGFVERLIADRDAKAEERKETEAEDGRFSRSWHRAVEKTQILSDQAHRSKQRAQALGTVLKSVASLVIYTMAIMMALAEFGISLGPLIAGAGIVGIAIGFGAQTLVQDFLSGIFMLVEDQYGVGDVIDVGDASGVVEEIKLRTTRLRDVNGTVWYIPNGEIRRIGNKSQQWARAVLDVEVSYDTDIPFAVSVIKETADTVWHDQLESATVLEEPEIWGVESLGASAVAIRLVLKVEPGEQWATAREVRKRLKIAFDEQGIDIPFPQRTVWVHNVTEADQPEPATHPDAEDFEAKGAPEDGA